MSCNRGLAPENFKIKQTIMELKITKEKVLEAASKCDDAKEILETLFPECFQLEYLLYDTKPLQDYLSSKVSSYLFGKIPGDCKEKKAETVHKLIVSTYCK